MHYDRTIVAYHGCDRSVADKLLAGKTKFVPSENDYDWLGAGIYFWEYGAHRAMQFAKEQKKRGKVKKPAVIGALLQLGSCFDLMDTRFTKDLAAAHPKLVAALHAQNLTLPVNGGFTPDKLLRRLDCAVINWYLEFNADSSGTPFDSVRCGFVEGSPVYEGAGIHQQSHVQVAIRNPSCIIGVFRPMLEAS